MIIFNVNDRFSSRDSFSAGWARLYILSQIYNRKCVKNELSKIYIYVQRQITFFFNISSLQSVSVSLLSSVSSSDKSTSSASSSAGTRDGDSPVSTRT